MIEHQKEKYGWDFMFLGANIDAVSTAAQFGIDQDFAVDYHTDNVGTKLNYEMVRMSWMKTTKLILKVKLRLLLERMGF